MLLHRARFIGTLKCAVGTCEHGKALEANLCTSKLRQSPGMNRKTPMKRTVTNLISKQSGEGPAKLQKAAASQGFVDK